MKHNFFYLLFFGLIISIYRIVPHPANFTPILSMAILAPLILKNRVISIALVLIPMFVSDIFIGFHPYQFVVYSTLISIVLITPMKKNYSILGLMAVGSSVWFFITTNFSVWLISDYYPKTLDGLITCYTLAIPFFSNTVVSTLMFTGMFILFYKYLKNINKKFNLAFYNILPKI